MIDPENTTDIAVPETAAPEKPIAIPNFGGSKHEWLNVSLFGQVARTAWRGDVRPEQVGTVDDPDMVAGGLLAELKPNDPMEGMLIAQMIGCHNAAVECFRRAMIPGQDPQLRLGNLNQANKLTRSYATLLQTLDKHRGKGQQKMTVEHVHIHAGGQAVVGSVTYGQQAQSLSLTQSAEASFSQVWEGALNEREG